MYTEKRSRNQCFCGNATISCFQTELHVAFNVKIPQTCMKNILYIFPRLKKIWDFLDRF
jgi:hypothetical protein